MPLLFRQIQMVHQSPAIGGPFRWKSGGVYCGVAIFDCRSYIYVRATVEMNVDERARPRLTMV